MPVGFDFKLNAKASSRPGVCLWSQTVIDAGPVLVPKSILDRLWAGKTHLYFWGWLEYKDAFPETFNHITMFCVELTEIKETSLLDPRKSSNEIGYTNCPQHNCEDEDCDGQPYGDGQIWHSVKR